MVVFSCSGCGQSLKKNKVESHLQFECRGSQMVTCIDCVKDFWGEEYKAHTKCFTENERYGGKNYEAKPNSNKGEIKQEKWIEHIKETISKKRLSGRLSGILNQLIELSNIPRKKTKFENFLRSSLKVSDPKLAAQVWTIFEEGAKQSNQTSSQSHKVNGEQDKCQVTTNQSVSQSTNQNDSQSTSKRELTDSLQANEAKKQRLNGAKEGSNGDSGSTATKNFDWCKMSELILLSNPQGAFEKKIRKEVIQEYRSITGDNETSDRDLKHTFRIELSKSQLFVFYKES